MKKLLYLFVAANLIAFQIASQTNVNYVTGSASANIPIYSLRGVNMDFPINLNYNGSGNKVNDVASRAGLGWSLSAGGSITRELHGLPDEDRTTYTQLDYGGGYLQANDYMVTQEFLGEFQPGISNQTGPAPALTIATMPPSLSEAQKNLANQGALDLEPDVFYVNAPGLSIKFMFGVDDRKKPNSEYPMYFEYHTNSEGMIWDKDPILCFPKQDISITYTRTQNQITSFTIINLDGIIYKFEQTQIASSHFKHGNTQEVEGQDYVQSWMLTEIINPNGQTEAEFEYLVNADFSKIAYVDEVKSNYSVGQITYGGFADDGEDPYNGIGPCMISDDLYKRTIVSNEMKYVHLHKVVTINGELEIVQGAERLDMDGDHRVHYVVWRNADGLQIGRTEFKYFYNNAGPNPSSVSPQDNYRLLLASIQRFGNDDLEIENPMFFSYGHPNFPPRNSYAQDHWGYYNNQLNEHLVCEYDFRRPFIIEGANKEAGGYGLELNKIVYPSGGYQKIEYEQHDYSQIGDNEYVNCTVPDGYGNSLLQTSTLNFGCYETETVETTSYPFTVGFDCKAVVRYGYEATPFPYYPQGTINCSEGTSTSYCFKFVSIHAPGNPGNPIWERFIPSEEEAAWSNTEVIDLPDGNWVLSVSIVGFGTVNFTNNVYGEVAWENLNPATQPVIGKLTAGGLRVKKIITSDGDADNSNNVVTRYEYGYDINGVAKSYGVLLSAPDYHAQSGYHVTINTSYTSDNLFNNSNQNAYTSVGYDCIYHVLTSGSITPLLNEQGAFVLYSNIKVYNESDGCTQGYTEYLYDVDDLPNTNHLVSGLNLTTSWENTALNRVNTYRTNDDGSFTLINSVEYFYHEDPSVTIYGQQVKQVDETGYENFTAIGIDPGVFEDAKKQALKDALRSSVSLILSNGPLSTYTALASIALGLGTWLYLEILQNNNEEQSINLIDDYSNVQYMVTKYRYVNQDFRVSYILTKEYDDQGNFIITRDEIEEIYLYNLPKVTAEKRGIVNPYRTIKSYVKYSGEYCPSSMSSNEPMDPALQLMRIRMMKSAPIEELTIAVDANGTEMIIGGAIHKYRVVNNKIVPHQEWVLELVAPTPFSSFLVSSTCGTSFTFDRRYRLVATYDSYDYTGNITSAHITNDIMNSVILDYPDGRAIANVSNAKPTEIAFTSFETDSPNGFEFDANAISSTTELHNGMELPQAKTGLRKYTLTSTGVVEFDIPQGKSILSLWLRNGDIVLDVAVNNAQVSTSINSEELPDALGWYYKEFAIESSSFTPITCRIIEETGSGNVWLDELRLYPSDALMVTASFYPNGKIHSVCDENNYCSYTGYDNAMRPMWVMDNEYNLRATKEIIPDTHSSTPMERQIFRIMLNPNTPYDEAFGAELNDYDLLTSQVFLDGLKRNVQTQAYKQSPGGKDVISGRKFNQFGRVERNYLPYTRNYSSENFISNFEIEQAEFYNAQPDIAHTDFAFAEKVYEKAPRARVLEAGSVGQYWQTGHHSMKQEITYNEANEVLLFVATTEFDEEFATLNYVNGVTAYYSACAMDGVNVEYWPANSLVKIKTTDENGKEFWQFIDPFGRLILKRSFMDAFQNGQQVFTSDLSLGHSNDQVTAEGNPIVQKVDTYYIYNLKGELKFELSPELMRYMDSIGSYCISEVDGEPGSQIFYNLGYSFVYDKRGNLVEKHSPETRNSYYVYDDIGQIVLAQNEQERIDSKWNFVRYDMQGRPAYSGILVYESDRESIQNLYYLDSYEISAPSDNYVCYEIRITDPTMPSVHGYSLHHGPAQLAIYEEILRVNYYDDYSFEHGTMIYDHTETLVSRSKGIPTGSLVRVLDQPTETFLTSVVYYDMLRRPVQIWEETLRGGHDKSTMYYSWNGQLIRTDRKLFGIDDMPTFETINEYEYDRTGRLLHHYQKTGNDPKVEIFGLQYNELGQLFRKHLHIPLGLNTGMQVIDYRYNERGWLRKINNSGLVDDGDNLEDNDVFGMDIIYHKWDQIASGNKFSPTGISPQEHFGGQISAIQYNTKAPEVDGTTLHEKAYVYRYDDLYRLTCGAFAAESHQLADYGMFTEAKNTFMEKTNYDLSGNITRLIRNRGKGPWIKMEVGTIDNLVYGYTQWSHRLKSVQELGHNTQEPLYSHFTEQSTSFNEYTYDKIGNCVADQNKNQEYQYNAIGLMSQATNANYPNDPYTVTYDASGRRLAKSVGGITTYYFNGVEYTFNGTTMEFVHATTAAGVVRYPDTQEYPTEFVYDYYLTDHLGNVRAVITEENSTEEVFVATMELENANPEEQNFEYIHYSRSAVSLGYPSTDNTGYNVSTLGQQNTVQGPANLSAVKHSDAVQVSVQSWFDLPQSNNTQQTSATILSGLINNLLVQGTGIVAGGPEALEVFQSAAPNAQLTALTDFLNDDLPTDLTHPQGYLIYVFFDEDLIVQESHSGILQVNDPGVLQTLQTVQLTMPSNGYFYTYLTNYSDQLVIFDNLTIRHKQGVLRAAYDYYPYGLPWDRVGSPYDETMSGTEFQTGEWGLEGLDLNYFAARYYDPILGRWHAPDPLEQCHSPYLAMLGDPANFIDPDGRAGIPFLQDFMKSDGGFFLEGLASMAGLAGAGGAYIGLVSNLGGVVGTVVSVGVSIYSAASNVHSLQEFNAKKGMQTYGSSANRFQFNIRNVFTSSFNSSTGPNNGHPGNPEEDSVWWDVLQFCVDIVGLVPGAGEAADAFNVGVSMYRGDSEGATLSLGAMMPVGGWGPGVSKLAKDFKRIMDKTGVTDWFKGLFSKSTKVKVDSPSYGEVVDDVAGSGKLSDSTKPLSFSQDAADALVKKLKAEYGGNVTVMKDGVDIFRVHQPGTHGSDVATITKIIEHNTPNGPMRRAASEISTFDQTTFEILQQASNGEGGFSLRTLGGK
jgi:RHS repeat-associated protein